MKTYIYLLLFLCVICADHRKPSKKTKHCLVEKLGKEQVKSLLSSFRKYHRSHGKAKFPEFINDKRPDLNETLNECLKKSRRLKRKLSKAKKMKKNLRDMLKGKINKPEIKNYRSLEMKKKLIKRAKMQ